MPTTRRNSRVIEHAPHCISSRRIGPGDRAREGCFLYTAYGAKDLRSAGGRIVAKHGHGRREVAEGLACGHASSLCRESFACRARGPLIERSAGLLPGRLNAIYLHGGGSEAVVRISVARQYHVRAARPSAGKSWTRHLVSHHDRDP